MQFTFNFLKMNTVHLHIKEIKVFLPKEHDTKQKCPQNQYENLCSYLELPLSSTSEQKAQGRPSHLASNFQPMKVFWQFQELPLTQTSFKIQNRKCNLNKNMTKDFLNICKYEKSFLSSNILIHTAVQIEQLTPKIKNQSII